MLEALIQIALAESQSRACGVNIALLPDKRYAVRVYDEGWRELLAPRQDETGWKTFTNLPDVLPLGRQTATRWAEIVGAFHQLYDGQSGVRTVLGWRDGAPHLAVSARWTEGGGCVTLTLSVDGRLEFRRFDDEWRQVPEMGHHCSPQLFWERTVAEKLRERDPKHSETPERAVIEQLIGRFELPWSRTVLQAEIEEGVLGLFLLGRDALLQARSKQRGPEGREGVAFKRKANQAAEVILERAASPLSRYKVETAAMPWIARRIKLRNSGSNPLLVLRYEYAGQEFFLPVPIHKLTGQGVARAFALYTDSARRFEAFASARPYPEWVQKVLELDGRSIWDFGLLP